MVTLGSCSLTHLYGDSGLLQPDQPVRVLDLRWIMMFRQQEEEEEGGGGGGRCWCFLKLRSVHLVLSPPPSPDGRWDGRTDLKPEPESVLEELKVSGLLEEYRPGEERESRTCPEPPHTHRGQ
ncbi:hypothetical protein INR49_020416 [Caranx melampygus]|nr:hypothetical protein INR49_020416 [Caranx melampygus]